MGQHFCTGFFQFSSLKYRVWWTGFFPSLKYHVPKSQFKNPFHWVRVVKNVISKWTRVRALEIHGCWLIPKLLEIRGFDHRPWWYTVSNFMPNANYHLFYSVRHCSALISLFQYFFLWSCMARSWNILLKFFFSIKIFVYFFGNIALYNCMIVQLQLNEFPTPIVCCPVSMI